MSFGKSNHNHENPRSDLDFKKKTIYLVAVLPRSKYAQKGCLNPKPQALWEGLAGKLCRLLGKFFAGGFILNPRIISRNTKITGLGSGASAEA